MDIVFNHMELSFPSGTITDEWRSELNSFYRDILGWESVDMSVQRKTPSVLLCVDRRKFILLAEEKEPMNRPGMDHLGLLLQSREELVEFHNLCANFAKSNEHMEMFNSLNQELIIGDLHVYGFYFRHLLPIWFDVQFMAWSPGSRHTELAEDPRNLVGDWQSKPIKLV